MQAVQFTVKLSMGQTVSVWAHWYKQIEEELVFYLTVPESCMAGLYYLEKYNLGMNSGHEWKMVVTCRIPYKIVDTVDRS